MIPDRSAIAPRSQNRQLVSLLIAIALLAAPISAQRRAPAPAKPVPTFDNLLAVDSYEVYGEVRNVGQLLSTGGAGEIVDPITKLAEPPKEFSAIIKFLKSNAEALATSRLLFATSPARTGIPATFVAIEFSSPEEADKFAPKLEKFLPVILPPVPDATPEVKSPDAVPTKSVEPAATPALPAVTPNATADVKAKATPEATPQPPAEHLPFVITHAGNLVCISDAPFKFEKLHPVGSKPLAEDSNFRIAHDRFSTESVFLFFNVALQERKKPQAQPTQITTEAETERKQEIEQESPEAEAAIVRASTESTAPEEQGLVVRANVPKPSPTPTPTNEQQAEMAASSQITHLLDFLGRGESQWPEAVGVALNLDNDEYVVRAILIESPSAKRLLLPFVPQLVSGPAYSADASSVLPDDTEVFISASIDFRQTYDGMRKQADLAAKSTPKQMPAGAKEEALDAFAAFEKKAGFKIKEDLLPVLGNEMAIAGSIDSLGALDPIGIRPAPRAKPSPETTSDGKPKAGGNFPVLLIAIKDRDAARPLLPRVFDGLGVGEANLIAQTERREETELVNYGGIFAYAFVGNFLVVSEATAVRRVIDAFVNHQTLSSNNTFRNFQRWQPRQILGEIYVSPAMMQAYQDEIRKQSTSMDPKMRDFLVQLNPTANAITYALSNDGLGEVHELHLPKNLIIAMVAGISSVSKPGPEQNEMIAMSGLQVLARVEDSYKTSAGKGSYGTLDQVAEAKLLAKKMLEDYGYKYELTVTGDSFEATATPVEYGTTGKRSFFIDKSGVVRGDDHGGAPANSGDKPVGPD